MRGCDPAGAGGFGPALEKTSGRDSRKMRADWIPKLDAHERATAGFKEQATDLLSHASDDLEGIHFQ